MLKPFYMNFQGQIPDDKILGIFAHEIAHNIGASHAGGSNCSHWFLPKLDNAKKVEGMVRYSTNF